MQLVVWPVKSSLAIIWTHCHRHGRLCDHRSTLFLYFAKSNSSPTPVDLIFPFILSNHVTFDLILPICLHVHSHMFLIFLLNALVIIL